MSIMALENINVKEEREKKKKRKGNINGLVFNKVAMTILTKRLVSDQFRTSGHSAGN